MKRYVVISQMTVRGPEYRIYDRVNEATVEGGFDTEKWAEAVAEMMEEKWEHEQRRTGKGVRRPPKHDKERHGHNLP